MATIPYKSFQTTVGLVTFCTAAGLVFKIITFYNYKMYIVGDIDPLERDKEYAFYNQCLQALLVILFCIDVFFGFGIYNIVFFKLGGIVFFVVVPLFTNLKKFFFFSIHFFFSILKEILPASFYGYINQIFVNNFLPLYLACKLTLQDMGLFILLFLVNFKQLALLIVEVTCFVLYALLYLFLLLLFPPIRNEIIEFFKNLRRENFFKLLLTFIKTLLTKIVNYITNWSTFFYSDASLTRKIFYLLITISQLLGLFYSIFYTITYFHRNSKMA